MMPKPDVDKAFLDPLLDRIWEGVIEGIRREVERCRRLGLPIYVERDGVIEAILPDGTRVPLRDFNPSDFPVADR